MNLNDNNKNKNFANVIFFYYKLSIKLLVNNSITCTKKKASHQNR